MKTIFTKHESNQQSPVLTVILNSYLFAWSNFVNNLHEIKKISMCCIYIRKMFRTDWKIVWHFFIFIFHHFLQKKELLWLHVTDLKIQNLVENGGLNNLSGLILHLGWNFQFKEGNKKLHIISSIIFYLNNF